MKENRVRGESIAGFLQADTEQPQQFAGVQKIAKFRRYADDIVRRASLTVATSHNILWEKKWEK